MFWWSLLSGVVLGYVVVALSLGYWASIPVFLALVLLLVFGYLWASSLLR